MPRDESAQPFYLIVSDHDRGVFAVEGPMTDDRPWKEAATFARNQQRRIVCGPTGAERVDAHVLLQQRARRGVAVARGRQLREPQPPPARRQRASARPRE